MVSDEVEARRRHQGGEFFYQFQWRQDDKGRTVRPGGFEAEGEVFVIDDLQTSAKALRAVSGIANGVGRHQLRRAFCSHGLMQGVDPRTMQKWMGHKDLATTLRYAHVSADHEKAAIERLRYDYGHQVVTKAEGT